jgi:hypothetical protein
MQGREYFTRQGISSMSFNEFKMLRQGLSAPMIGKSWIDIPFANTASTRLSLTPRAGFWVLIWQRL